VLTGDDSGRRSDDLLALQNIDNSPLLVMALARQLNGTLEVERGQGALCVIRFPECRYARSATADREDM
jgi:hypothetical protein